MSHQRKQGIRQSINEPAQYSALSAKIHNLLFSEFSEYASNTILELLSEQNRCFKTITDLGCGSGQALSKFSQAGFKTIGIDSSKDMLSLASENSPRSTLFCRSFVSNEPIDTDVYVSINESFNYANPEKPRTLDKIIYQISQNLKSGGMLIFDLLSPTTTRVSHSMAELNDITMFVENRENSTEQCIDRYITYFKKKLLHSNIDLYEKKSEKHYLSLYKKDEVVSILDKNGFTVTVEAGYRHLRLPFGHNVYIAQKN